MATYSNSDGRYTLYLYLTEESTSIDNNTSTVSWSLVLQSSNYNFYQHTIVRNVYLNGSNVASISNQTGVAMGGSVTLASGRSSIPHESDGTKSLNFSASISTPDGASYLPRSISLSGSMQLTTIPRASSATITNATPRYGDAVTINIQPAISGFTHTLHVGANGHISWKKIAEGVGTSYTWTVPTEFAKSYTTQDNVLWLWVETFNGSTKIGDKIYWEAFKLQPAESMRPSGSIYDKDMNSDARAAFGIYCKGLSKLQVDISAYAKMGASIKSITTTLAGQTYSGSKFETDVLQVTGSREIKSVITDSRGQSTTETKQIYIYDYIPPVLNEVKFDQSGSSIVINIKGKIDSVQNKNVKKLVVKYKAVNEEIWSERNINLYSYNVDVSSTLTGLDTSLTYDILVELSDAIETVTSQTTTGTPVLSFLAGGDGARFFGDAKEKGLWVKDFDYTITDKEYVTLMEMLS